ncbi:hypothetical protein [Paenarthrobacter ureafaciens]|jgi:hypothetical protein|uniref:hypothetical protein n=1 Tax=Paenarthrobacter ureafaciens TaxID=37931 RepID=UPI00140DD1C3|nr:hypothetical protein [Paenarthrobacter ureafaciens]MCX8453018.1 hypothetical protein [Paenarthrobacter ureafaciens]MCY0971656.1 hypothetical protein [Paenarthrobacter ureafaciens]
MGTFRDSLDTRALRFALFFPLLLAIGFVVCAQMLRNSLPDPVAVMWNADGGSAFAPFGAYVAGGAAMITLFGWLAFMQAVPLSRPVVMRRVMMGLGLMVSLFVTTVLAAGLVGQSGIGEARLSHVDPIVLAMGSGAALALGVVMMFAFKPDARWTPEDDQALETERMLLADPDLTRDTLRIWVHARSSVFIMIIVSALFPAALIAVALPWLGALVAAVALLGAGFLFARVRADRGGLRVLAGGLVPVLSVPAVDIAAAAPADVKAADYGGWGLRHHDDATAMLVSSGPAVVVRKLNGGRVALSAGTAAAADTLAGILNRAAARAHDDGQPQ